MAVSDKDQAKARVIEARQALDDDLATLSDRLPAASVVAQAGAASGTALALLGVAAKQLQKRLAQRSEERALTREAEIQAKAIAAAIAAAGLRGGDHGVHGDHGDEAAAPPRRGSRPKVSVPVLPPTRDDGDDDGPPWGILLLLAALVAAVIALVAGAKDDEDLWSTPGA